MKRAALWAIGIGALVSTGPLAMEQGYAGEHERGCTLATLDGQYLFSSSGPLFPPAFGVTSESIGSAAGAHVFYGDGTGADYVSFSVNGIDEHVPSPIPTTYTLNPDCTGTYQAPSAGLHFDIFVAVDGSQLSLIETDPGSTSAQGPLPRVRFDR
jgi:hypothetical protein